MVNRRKFRSQTSDNMERWKSRDGKSQGGEVKKWEDQSRERVSSKKMQVREKVGKSRFTAVFKWFGAPEGRKVIWLKRRVRSQLARWEMNNCTPLWREAHLELKKAKDTSRSDCFWKLRCRKSARRCGAKHISKAKCAKHTNVSPLLEAQMSKKCTLLWREAHFQVKSVKNWRVRTTFWRWDVEKVHAVVARSTCPSQNVQSTPTPDHFWKLRCRKNARRCGAKHISKWKVSKTEEYGPLFDVQMLKQCTPLCREAHFHVKSVKNWGCWAFCDVQMSKKCTLPDLTSLTRLTDLTFLNNLTILTN